MEWILSVIGGIVVCFGGSWLFWHWRNVRKLSVSIETKGVMANIPLHPSEEHIVEVTITNVGNKSVNVKECWFIVDGERKHIAVDRSRLLTMQESLPTRLEPDEQWIVGYPAEAFYGRQLSRVTVEDHIGNSWRAASRGVKKVSAELRIRRAAA